MSCSLFYSVDLRREQPGFFDNEKQSFKHWGEKKTKKKKGKCYGILVLWYIEAIIFQKKVKMIGVSQTRRLWIRLRKNYFYGCPEFP